MNYHISSGVLRSYVKEYYKIVVLALAGLFIFTQFFALMQSSSAQVSEDFTEDGKVWICHANNAANNRYTANNVSVDGLNGHGDHDGPFAYSEEYAEQLKKDKIDWGDVMPPVGQFPGLNWEEGEQYWRENCDKRGEVIGDQCEVGPGYAYELNYFVLGTKKNGSAITGARADAIHVLDNPDATTNPDDGFMSLGNDGWVVVSFNGYVVDVQGNDLSFHEVTNGRSSYPEEKIDVEVSQDMVNWESVGTVSNKGSEVNYLDFSSTGYPWIKYVRITDATDYLLHVSTADGYDLDAVDASMIVCEEPQPEYIPCEVGQNIFQIGDIETDQEQHPADEFTGTGNAGDFSVSHADPFVVGVNTDDEFPWNSNFNKGYATDFDVNFNYNGSETVTAKLVVAWSPGKSASENKIISLDGTEIANITRVGVSVGGWYNSSEVFPEEITFELSPGDHTLRFQHTSGDGTFWDYIKLDITDCPEVEGDNDERDPIGVIRGLIYEDVNGNGSQQPKELPLEGWESYLFTHNSPFTLFKKAITDENGLFVFEHLEFGSEFYVCQILKDGWEQTEIPAGFNSIDELELDEVVLNESELHDNIKKYCYGPIILDEENPEVDFSIFGNHKSTPGVLSDVDDKSNEGGQGGAVLADSDTLADTGNPYLTYVLVGFSLISSAGVLTAIKIRKD